MSLGPRKRYPNTTICDECGDPVSVGDFPICKGQKGKHEPQGKSSPFKSFLFDADNGEVMEISSLPQLREVERRSMERYEAGLKGGYNGGRPFNFREYSQDKSNSDEGVFGRVPADIKDFDFKKARTKAGRKITGGAVEFAPTESLD